ncbi:hypothetical protein CSC70_08645 [Pseudoxanthomonas kalamensis DSM 18571]|uniref:ATP-binding protein n=1 Tax=Pseudoxanthomonas kalamensis TaxID=289483 RepID=UPI0013917887|nr:ATP-binding protein [Pseudoxanthomonas kalamensis]KAF1709758.1 hypothetical protein CSC70_08645 [Pseudoxanthomonas kalamensis DSM 18571]
MTVFYWHGKPIVPSLSMEDSLTKLASAIEAEYKGAGLHSLTRFGKSTLAEYIYAYHDWIDIPYVAKRADVRSIGSGESAMFDWFLTQIGVQPVARQLPDQKLNRIVNTVTMQLQSASARLYLLIVDDANLIEPDAFQHFITIDNALEKSGISLFVVFLFQDNHTTSKREQINKLVVSPQIRSRFLTRYHRIFGIRGPDDIFVFIQRFEDEVEMALEAGITLPRSMAPALYDSNWRMRNASGMIWEQGCIHRAAAGHSDIDEWPMKAFSLIVYYLSTRVICEPGFTGFTTEHIDQAIRFSDLAAFDGESGAVEFSDDP